MALIEDDNEKESRQKSYQSAGAKAFPLRSSDHSFLSVAQNPGLSSRSLGLVYRIATNGPELTIARMQSADHIGRKARK
jgi:hypothetical protein